MGGKFWSPEEQEYFIHEVMTKSRFNGKDGAYNPNKGMSWTELADMIQHDMDERKIDRRQYTGNMFTESPDYTSNHSLMTCYPAPESYSTRFEGSSMAQRPFPDPPMNPGLSTDRHFHPYRAPDAYRQSRTRDPAIYHHQRYPERPEAQTPLQTRDPETHMRITSTTPSKSPHQPLNLQQRLPIMIRDPTPDDDENSLFVEQNYSEYNRRTSIPRPNTELDAAVTMTMFHRQEMHTLHGTPARKFGQIDGRRTIQQVHPDDHAYQRYIGDNNPGFRLAASTSRADTGRRSQKQDRSGQLEKSDENDENDENGNE
ncbi:hypothetical protein BOTNAR_0235g00090 [Botryotinia narcissicola]|uniref:Uncharacterized protein n=1 Tax=Botryotinia narcissicola TaxID=278944 RepID=A0A4Z1IGY6_9HELO|nr:hypothetical protein BOTNAR_0235g00090 [Botryotinia narcissicola]